MTSDWREEVDFCFHWLSVLFTPSMTFLFLFYEFFKCLKSFYLFIVEAYIANEVYLMKLEILWKNWHYLEIY